MTAQFGFPAGPDEPEVAYLFADKDDDDWDEADEDFEEFEDDEDDEDEDDTAFDEDERDDDWPARGRLSRFHRSNDDDDWN